MKVLNLKHATQYILVNTSIANNGTLYTVPQGYILFVTSFLFTAQQPTVSNAFTININGIEAFKGKPATNGSSLMYKNGIISSSSGYEISHGGIVTLSPTNDYIGPLKFMPGESLSWTVTAGGATTRYAGLIGHLRSV